MKKRNFAVDLARSKIMKKSCEKFLPRFNDFVYLQPTSQNTPDSDLLLEKHQNKWLGKGFMRQIY